METIITRSEFEKIKQKTLIIDVHDNWEHQKLKKIFLELVSKPENYIKGKN